MGKGPGEKKGWQRALRRLFRRAKIKKADGTLKPTIRELSQC
jgi:hypothetical protein